MTKVVYDLTVCLFAGDDSLESIQVERFPDINACVAERNDNVAEALSKGFVLTYGGAMETKTELDQSFPDPTVMHDLTASPVDFPCKLLFQIRKMVLTV